MSSHSSNIIVLADGKLKLRLSPYQYQVFNCPKRFRVLVGGRRFGKSELALAELVKAALDKPNSIVLYICPSETQAKRIIWRRLKYITRKWQAQKPNESEKRIELINNSVIVVKGAFDPDSLRGEGLNFIVLDEVADIKAETWPNVLRPSLADRQGKALFIGTPKGRTELYDHFEMAKSSPDWAAFQFTTEQGGLVTQSELESVSRETDPNVYRREYQAEFTVVGEYRAYLSFQPESNIREVRFEPSQPLIWSLDFNVDPMCMLLMQRVGENINVLEEIIVRSNSTTTLEACRVFLERAEPYRKAVSRLYGAMEVHLYGDASGSQRRTSATATDWTLIREFFNNFHKGTVEISSRYANINPHVRDRINCVNARLRNHYGDSRLFINPTCKELIRDLEEVCFNLDANKSPTNDLNKSDRNRTHTSDALGYYVSQIFPLRGTFNLCL